MGNLLLLIVFASPIMIAGAVVYFYSKPSRRPKAYTQSFVYLLLYIAIGFGPLLLFPLTRESADLSWGAIALIPIVGINMLAIFAGYVANVITVYRHKEKISQNKTPLFQSMPWLVVLFGSIIALLLMVAVSDIVTSVQKRIYPHGLKGNDYYAATAQAIANAKSINATDAQRILIGDFLANPNQYNNSKICILGRLDFFQGVGYIRNSATTLGQDTRVFVPADDAIKKISCSSGSSCSGDLTLCGIAMISQSASGYAFGPSYLDSNKQLVVSNIMINGTPQESVVLDLPYLQVN